MLENGLDRCTCPKEKCVRHGNCKECMEYHGRKGKLPRCKRVHKSIFSKWFKV